MIVNQQDKRGFGTSEIIGIAVVVVIAAAVIVPGLRHIAERIMDSAKTWVSTKLANIFETASAPVN